MKTILAAGALSLVCCGTLLAAEPPNIVFFFADDQTISTLGCYGNSIVQTPHIDSLAARGTRFDNAFVSHSICWVSRTTILTGLTGRSYGTASQARTGSSRRRSGALLPTSCGPDGYRTGYFRKMARQDAGWLSQGGAF